MGSQKVKERRAGVRRPGPRQRRDLAMNACRDSPVQQQARITRLVMQNAKKAKSRALNAKREADRQELLNRRTEQERVERIKRDTMRSVEDSMTACEENKLASVIVEFIRSNLDVCPGPRSRKSVFGRVLDHSRISADVPDYVLPKKVAVAQQEILRGVSIRLDEVRSANSASKLAIKHAILDASILEQGDSSARQVARVLRIHHRNVSKAVLRREVLYSAGDFLFFLSVRTKRADGIALDEKQIIIKWWISETRVSPNKKDVTRKRISATVRDEKATHYLQETQVWQSSNALPPNLDCQFLHCAIQCLGLHFRDLHVYCV